MNNIRKYGCAPFPVAVIHGGPGAAGEMAPVAQELSRTQGVLEPLQTKATINAQIQELADILKNHGNPPLTLIGHSWGAWLAMMYTVRYPSSVKKLILVGSGPFEQHYVSHITETRLSRMNDEEKQKFQTMTRKLNDPHEKEKDTLFAQLGSFLVLTDSCHPLTSPESTMDIQYRIFHGVWNEADTMRRSGQLLDLARQLQCPVVAIHGDYDPHPFEGVEQPLSKIVKEFSFILLHHCGHYPWIERDAKKEFYAALERELRK
jgi:pimeloyl-ACP methyl ester carboxylesterase